MLLNLFPLFCVAFFRQKGRQITLKNDLLTKFNCCNQRHLKILIKELWMFRYFLRIQNKDKDTGEQTMTYKFISITTMIFSSYIHTVPFPTNNTNTNGIFQIDLRNKLRSFCYYNYRRSLETKTDTWKIQHKRFSFYHSCSAWFVRAWKQSSSHQFYSTFSFQYRIC